MPHTTGPVLWGMTISARPLLHVPPTPDLPGALAHWNEEMDRQAPAHLPGPGLHVLRDRGPGRGDGDDDETLHARILLESLPEAERRRPGHWMEILHAGIAYAPGYRRGHPLTLVNRAERGAGITGGILWFGNDHATAAVPFDWERRQALWRDALESGHSAAAAIPRLRALIESLERPTPAERERLGSVLELYRDTADGPEEWALHDRARRLLDAPWSVYLGAVLG
jgi:hypothetical protein